MSSKRYTSKIGARNELETFTLVLTGRETSSLKKSLKSIKVDEGKCEGETKVSPLSNVFCFTTNASGATFATDVAIPWVRIVP
jgi:hypothetical protein